MKTQAYMIKEKSSDLTGIISFADEDNVTIEWSDDNTTVLTNEELEEILKSDDYDIEEVELVDEAEEVNDAQNSIRTHSTTTPPGEEADGNPKTRYDWLRLAIGNLADMDEESLESFVFQQQQAQVGGESTRAGLDDNVNFNQASISMKPSAALGNGMMKLEKEERDAIFGETDLTEEAKAKMTVLFETAVFARVSDEVIKIQKNYDESMDKNVKEMTESIVNKIDEYMDHVVTEWIKENEVAIESSLRTNLVEEFISKLHDLFVENYIDVPEDKVDVLEAIIDENEALKEQLNDQLNETIEKENTIKALNKVINVDKLSEGLTLVQKTQLKKLTESTDFNTEEEFVKKVQVIKEGFLKIPSKDTNILTENLPVVEEEKVSGDPAILAVAKLI